MKPDKSMKSIQSNKKFIKTIDDSDTRSINGYHEIPIYIDHIPASNKKQISLPDIDIMKKILVSRGFIEAYSSAPESIIQHLFLISLKGNIQIEKHSDCL